MMSGILGCEVITINGFTHFTMKDLFFNTVRRGHYPFYGQLGCCRVVNLWYIFGTALYNGTPVLKLGEIQCTEL